MKTSDFLSLNWTDIGKGLLVAIASSVVSVIMASINAGDFNFTWPAIWHGAVVGFVGYISKNFFTPQTIVTKADVNTPVK